MALDLGTFFATYGIKLLYWAVGIIIFLIVGLFFFFKVWLNKRWNLIVEYKMVRSDGRFVQAEIGKGNYDLKNGIIWLKRGKKKAEGCKIDDLKKYLQGSKIITVIGNPGNWKIVIPDSFLEVVDEETGQVASIMELKTNTKEDRAWEVAFDRSFSEAFSIADFFSQYGQYLGWGILIFIVVISQFVGFSIVLDKIKP